MASRVLFATGRGFGLTFRASVQNPNKSVNWIECNGTPHVGVRWHKMVYHINDHQVLGLPSDVRVIWCSHSLLINQWDFLSQTFDLVFCFGKKIKIYNILFFLLFFRFLGNDRNRNRNSKVKEKNMFHYLTLCSIYDYMVLDMVKDHSSNDRRRKEEFFLFNDTLNIF